jgi:hypothetical protein
MRTKGGWKKWRDGWPRRREGRAGESVEREAVQTNYYRKSLRNVLPDLFKSNNLGILGVGGWRTKQRALNTAARTRQTKLACI